MPAFDPLDPLDHPLHSIPEILVNQLAAANRREHSADPKERELAGQHRHCADMIRQAMANREQYDRDHDAKQTRECEPL